MISKPMRSLLQARQLDEAVNYSVDRGYNSSNRRMVCVMLRDTAFLLYSLLESADHALEDLMMNWFKLKVFTLILLNLEMNINM